MTTQNDRLEDAMIVHPSGWIELFPEDYIEGTTDLISNRECRVRRDLLPASAEFPKASVLRSDDQ